jgi:hypothetical protein
MTTERTTCQGFQWPPREQPPAPISQSLVAPQPQSALKSMIESIETDLLGREGIAFDVWAQQTGWQPEDESKFCWRCAGSVGTH